MLGFFCFLKVGARICGWVMVRHWQVIGGDVCKVAIDSPKGMGAMGVLVDDEDAMIAITVLITRAL